MKLVPLVLSLLAALAFSLPAHAEEAPDYTGESLIFVESDLPSGWKLLDADALPEGLPSEDKISEAGGEGVDAFELMVEHRLISDGTAKVVIAIVDADVEGGPAAYRKGLDALAAATSGKVVELGHPQRLLFLAGPADKLDALVKWHRTLAAQKLATLGYTRLLQDFQNGAPGKTSRRRGTEYAEAALRLEAGMPAAKSIKGFIQIFEKDTDGGISTLRGTLETSGALAPSKRMKWFGWGLIARALVVKEDGKKASEAEHKDAVVAFRKALQFEDEAFAEATERNDDYLRLRVWGTRYNLCCSLAALDRKGEAMKELATCMTTGKRLMTLGDRWQRWFEHVWFWDEDMEPLRADKGFMELMKKNAPDKYDWTKRTEELQKAKKKRDEAKAKREAEEKKAKEGSEGGEGKEDGKDGGAGS